ncbi:MAG: PorT family protein [Bacteroidota bacterium]|nr:PorT family protein [Bacteroidota bacterium]
MKTKLFTLAFLLFIGPSVFSQSFSLGIKGGANLGKISGQSFKDQFALGYHAGVFASIGLGKKFAIQPEVLFSQTNVDTTSKFSDVYAFNNIGKIQLKYLTIPILLNYKIAPILTLQAGPQFGILLDKNNTLLQNGQNAFKSGNFALAAGLQLNLLKFKVYGRFIGGQTDINNFGSGETWKTQSIQLGVGFAL